MLCNLWDACFLIDVFLKAEEKATLYVGIGGSDLETSLFAAMRRL